MALAMFTGLLAGASSRTRTDDRLITNQVLYQLSYAGLKNNLNLRGSTVNRGRDQDRQDVKRFLPDGDRLLVFYQTEFPGGQAPVPVGINALKDGLGHHIALLTPLPMGWDVLTEISLIGNFSVQLGHSPQ